MKQIQSTFGHVALVDDADFERVNQYNWYAHNSLRSGGCGSNGKRPARREGSGKRKVIFLAREIMGPTEPGFVIDHINGDPWDNRRENLRICTHAENLRNQRRPIKRSGARKGVHRSGRLWKAIIRSNNEVYNLGSYIDKRVAELAYDAAALFLNGEFASLNYPEVATHPQSPETLKAAADLARTDSRKNSTHYTPPTDTDAIRNFALALLAGLPAIEAERGQ